MLKWQEVFNKNEASMPINSNNISYQISNLIELKRFLDIIHIKTCLIKPYQQNKNYPLVEGRDLLPSFDNDMFEYKDLPSFALVAFAMWDPASLAIGALLFGFISNLGSNLQVYLPQVPVELYSMMPYIVTIVVFILSTGNFRKKRTDQPAMLAQPYDREAR